MAMNQEEWREKQEDIWIAHRSWPWRRGIHSISGLNELLEVRDSMSCGRIVCRFYHARLGGPSLDAGV